MLLVDTNILLAAADTSTTDHTRCAAVLDDNTDLAVTAPVAVETAWMIESRLGPDAEAAFVASIADNELAVIDLTAVDWSRCAPPTATPSTSSPERPGPRRNPRRGGRLQAMPDHPPAEPSRSSEDNSP